MEMGGKYDIFWAIEANLVIFDCLGQDAILKNIGVDIDVGILEADKIDRENAFGSNYREPAKANTWFSFLLQ